MQSQKDRFGVYLTLAGFLIISGCDHKIEDTRIKTMNAERVKTLVGSIESSVTPQITEGLTLKINVVSF